MDRTDQLLNRAERAQKAIPEHGSVGLDEYDAKYEEAEGALDDLCDMGGLDELTQDQMITFLELTRNMSWDIPSALMQLCSHLDGEEYFMHRVSDKEKADMGYPRADSAYQGPASVSEWSVVDNHFKEVHGWDMNDKRINWEFDT